jgi:hypothetical protein
MPFQFHEGTTPQGLKILVVDAAGQVNLAHGHELEAKILPGQAHHGGYLLSRVAAGTEYSPDVRKFFKQLNPNFAAMAVVVTSPIVRAAINLMLRFNNDQRLSFRMFTDEDEAKAWLDSRALSR